MKWEVTTPATALALSWDEVRHHLRIDDFDERAYVEDLIRDVTAIAEDATAACLQPQTITSTFYEGSSTFVLPRGPVQSVTSVTSNGTLISSDHYKLQRIGSIDWVVCNIVLTLPVVIVAQHGYATLPRTLRRAMLNEIGAYYENRESMSEKSVSETEALAARIYERLNRTLRVS